MYAMAYGNSTLYSGLYDAAGNGTLWGWNGSSWTWTGGGYVNASWGFYNLQSVEATAVHEDKLYAGTGLTVAGNAMVWEFDGTNWQVVGGQGVRGSWGATRSRMSLHYRAITVIYTRALEQLPTTPKSGDTMVPRGQKWVVIALILVGRRTLRVSIP